MLQSHSLSRTLIGKGGIRLINHPGVIFPESVLAPSPGTQKNTGKAYPKAPSWGITTREAMHILHCSAPAARRKLSGMKVKFHLVRRSDGPPEIYWNRKQVENIVKNSPAIVKTPPAKLLDTKEAIALLGLARSALHRYTRSGKLRVTVIRITTTRGLRTRCYYRRADILSLVRHLRTNRRKEHGTT